MTKRSNLRMSCRKCHCEYKKDGFEISVIIQCEQKYDITLNPKIKQHLSFEIMMPD